MALAELRVRLNASTVVSAFAGNVRGPIAQLGALGVGVDPAAGAGAATATGQLDLSAIVTAAERIAEQIVGRDLDLPSPDAVLAPLVGLLQLVEDVDPRKLDATVRAAIAQVTGTLGQAREGRFDTMVERIVAQLGMSPEGRELLRIAARLLQMGGVDAAVLGEVKALLPAALGTIRAIAGIVRVESALSEAERLTTTMRAQLGGAGAQLEVDALGVSLEYAVDRLRAAATDPGVEPEARRATVDALMRIDLTRDAMARRLAFAESTLLFADVAGMVREAQSGLDDAQGVDLQAAGASIGRMIDRLLPAFTLPMPPAPADGFDALLRLIEAQVQEIARRIEAVDVAKAGAPVAALAGAVTAPIHTVERLATELMTGAQGAIERVGQLVSDLPTGEVVSAVETVTAPVRDAMDAVAGVVEAADAGIRTLATAGTTALGAAEHAVDTLADALLAVMNAAATFVRDLNLDAALGALQEQLDALGAALAQADVRPYFSAAIDAIDTTASVLEKVPVVLLPDDIKAEFDTLVEPIRSLNVDAVALEVESWFDLQDGHFPFEPTLEAALAEVRALLDTLITDIEPFNPRNLGATVDAELVPLRAQIARLDIGPALAPVEQAVAKVKGMVAGVDPRAALAPVSQAMHSVTDRLDAFSPGTLLAPVQARIVAARESVIDTLHLEAASQGLSDIQREAVSLVTRLDPVNLTPAIARGLATAQSELHRLDGLSIGEWVGALIASLTSGDGGTRPATWAAVQAWLRGDEAASRLRGRAERIVAAVADSAATVTALDLDAAAGRVTAGMQALRAAVDALPAGGALRLSLTDPVQRRSDDGGFVSLGANASRFAGELADARTAAAALLPLEYARVDVTSAALRALGAPVFRLRDQLLAVFRQVGLRHAGDGLGAILAEILEVATPERLAAIFVPIYTALRGRAEALLGAVIDPMRTAIDDLVRLLRLIDLTKITQALDDVLNAGKAQILALDPVQVLEPSLAAFDTLRADVLAFDPVGPLRALVDTLRATVTRVLDKLSVERLLAPAAALFDELIATLRKLDPDALVGPLVNALHTLAADIHGGLEQLREALKRLQAAIPSSDGLAGAVAGAIGDVVDVDVDISF